MTSVPEMLRLSYFLTVKTLKLTAPWLLDYLQPSFCFDQLKNEQVSLKEACAQESQAFVLLSSPGLLTVLLVDPAAL